MREAEGVILVTGAVPGATGSFVVVRPAIKVKREERSNPMSATILTVQAAKQANIDVIENGKYTQAVHDVVVRCAPARRSGTANTKSKADVNLSGAKPWRQKGTGRARAGYKSSPVWVGGGVAFGPKPRDYSKKVPKSVRRVALRKALIDADYGW